VTLHYVELDNGKILYG